MISVMQDCQVRQLSMGRNEGRGVGSASFLLAQLGNHAATKFAERLEPLGFAPHHAGIFRILAQNPGLSQQDLAKTLCIHASSLVGILDELQQRGLVERRPSERDRRLYSLHLTPDGDRALRRIGEAAREHHQALMAGLSADQQKQLTDMLEIIVKNQNLTRGVHPGYRRLDSADPRTEDSHQ
ncbi:MAG TPA: MarR family transcriptional regulator [Terracidiphilus sp.]|nr:MarR family transcriptional regulator [Terracidiphilus sp.]